MILASFFDVNDNGLDVTDLAAILGFILLGIGAVVGLFRWSRRQLRDEISEVVRCEIAKATQPIQPGYRNGGESLADVAHTLKRIAEASGINLMDE